MCKIIKVLIMVINNNNKTFKIMILEFYKQWDHKDTVIEKTDLVIL